MPADHGKAEAPDIENTSSGQSAMRIGEWAWRLGLAVLAGIGIFLGFPPATTPYMAWTGLIPLFFAVRGTNGRTHFLLGLCAGTVANLGILYWVTGLLVNFGHMPVFVTRCT